MLADAQLTDPTVMAAFGVEFDPMDVPRDRFLVAGRPGAPSARARRTPYVRPAPARGPMVGEWFVAGNIRLDLAALNKVETLLWDVWGVGAANDADMTDAIRELYDGVADVAGEDVTFEAARTLFNENDAVRTPRTVLSMAPFNGSCEVTLR
ncbi:hypothetical protein NKH77_23500 [Streptomyces sp. M19]